MKKQKEMAARKRILRRAFTGFCAIESSLHSRLTWQSRRYSRSGLPLPDRARLPTIQALRRSVIHPAIGTAPESGECVKGLPALTANPVRPDDRSGAALRTSEAFTPRQAGQSGEKPGLLKTAPAIKAGEKGKNAHPGVLSAKGKGEQCGHTNKTNYTRNHEAAGPPN